MSNSDQNSRLDPSRSREARKLHLREVTDQDPDDSSYDGVGQDLRNARLNLGKDRREVAKELHIKRSYVQAIEDGHFEQMPASVYAYGFVRSYAEFLGLDEDQIVRRFKDEWEDLSGSTRLAFPEPPEEIRLPKGPILAFSLLLAVAVYGGWYFMSQSSRIDVEKVPDVPVRLAGDTESGKEVSGKDLTAVAEPKTTPQAQAQVAKVDSSEPTPATSVKATAPAPKIEVPAPVVAEAAAPDVDEPQKYGQSNAGRVVVRAKANAWVQIQADQEGGEVFLTRILHAGDEYRAPARNDLFLMTGNAGGLEILVDGRKVESIGALGVVRRHVMLDPDRLITGTAIDGD